LLPAGLRVAQSCRYFISSVIQKWVFCPAGATHCPDKREVWQQGADRRSSPPRQISRLSRQKRGKKAPKNVNISNFGHTFALQGDSFAHFLRFCTFLWVDFKLLIWSLSGGNQLSYKHFPAVGAYSHKCSMASSGELLIKSKKLGDAKMIRTSSITTSSVVGIVGRAPAVDDKV